MGSFRQRQLHLGEAHDAAGADTLPPVVEFAEMANIVLRRRGGFLDFHWIEGSIHDDQQVDLQLVLVPVIVQRRLAPAVKVAFKVTYVLASLRTC